MNDSLTQIQSICKHGIALAKEISGPWAVWPTHWAGGSDSRRYDGHNTIWIDSPQGEIMRIRPDAGRVTNDTYAKARFVSGASTLLPAALTALQEATDYINGFTTCDGEDCDCRHHTAAKSVLARIAASLTAAQTP